jgi:fructan beta-fructosidase
MAVYDEHANKQWIAFYTSPDLKRWEYRSRIEGFFECPDIFELPIAGTSHRRWVLYGADGQYVLGDFDGAEFRPGGGKQQLWFGNFYAAQTFSNAPQGRRIQIGWGRGITFPDQPFNQQMTIPCELSLQTGAAGVRMIAWPVKELENLYAGPPTRVPETTLQSGEPLRGTLPSDLIDASLEVQLDKAASFSVSLRGVPVSYQAAKQELTCQGQTAPLAVADGLLRLRLLVDRGSLEVFGENGVVAMSLGIQPAADERQWTVQAEGGPARLLSAEFQPLQAVLSP